MALDPRYGSRKTREFMTGGLAGQVVLNSRVSLHQASALHVSFIHSLHPQVCCAAALGSDSSENTTNQQMSVPYHPSCHNPLFAFSHRLGACDEIMQIYLAESPIPQLRRKFVRTSDSKSVRAFLDV